MANRALAFHVRSTVCNFDTLISAQRFYGEVIYASSDRGGMTMLRTMRRSQMVVGLHFYNATDGSFEWCGEQITLV